MLITEIDQLAMTCRGSARLPEWLGTELRGMVREHFKRMVCRHHEYVPGDESQLPECVGCSLRVDCPYARVFEPFVPRADGAPPQDEPTRPVVLAPEYPSAKDVSEGSRIPFRLLLIDGAISALAPLLQAIGDAGQRHGLGPKRQRVKVHLENLAQARHRQHRLNLATLQTESTSTAGSMPRVQIQLTSPLRLLRHGAAGKQLVDQPDCRDLVAVSLRVIRGLTQISGEICSANDEQLIESASEVVVIERTTEIVEQVVQTNKGARRVPFTAITGSLTLADVPLSLLPWLYWGGKLHVGDRRAAGAGGWRLNLD